MTVNTDRTAALVRGVRDKGGTVLEARRLMEALATDDQQRLREGRQRREDELLAADLGFGSADSLCAAVGESHGIAGGGVFPQEASTAEPRGVRAALEQMEEERISEQAGEFIAGLLIDDLHEKRSDRNLAEALGTTPEDLGAMLEGAPRPGGGVDRTATEDLRVAETIGVPAETLSEALDEVFAR